MKQYQVTGRVFTVHAGIVQLTPAQAAARRHCTQLVDSKKGLYHVTGECHFKHGEQFRWDGDVPKATAVDVAELEEERKAKAATEPTPAPATGPDLLYPAAAD